MGKGIIPMTTMRTSMLKSLAIAAACCISTAAHAKQPLQPLMPWPPEVCANLYALAEYHEGTQRTANPATLAFARGDVLGRPC